MLSNNIIKKIIPSEGTYSDYIDGIDYHDTFEIKGVYTELSAQEAYRKLFLNTSTKWINSLMNIRNKLMSFLGFKTVSETINIDTQVLSAGNKVGMFEIYYVDDNEVIAGEKDKHLDFTVSVIKYDDRITVSTMVKYHNLFGRVYMTCISPFHELIVKHIMKNLT